MCMSSPKMPDVPPPTTLASNAYRTPPLKMAASAMTERSMANALIKKRKRGTKRLTVSRRPTLGMQSSGQTGVQMPS